MRILIRQQLEPTRLGTVARREKGLSLEVERPELCLDHRPKVDLLRERRAKIVAIHQGDHLDRILFQHCRQDHVDADRQSLILV